MGNYNNNLNNMMCLDIFLMSLDNREYEKIKHKIDPLIHKPHPLNSWDISGNFIGTPLQKGGEQKI